MTHNHTRRRHPSHAPTRSWVHARGQLYDLDGHHWEVVWVDPSAIEKS